MPVGDRFSPIADIRKWWLADQRPGLSRTPGAALSLKNLFPNLTGEERVRPGYSQYSSSDGGPTPGQDMPGVISGSTKLFRIGTIQNPVQADVHVKFFDAGAGQFVYMNPWWQGAAQQNTDLQINETINLSGQAVTYPGTHNQMVLTGAPLGQADGYFNGWQLQVGSKYAIVTGWVQSSNTFTFLEDVDATGLNLGSPITGTFSRNFHDNPTFSPAFNNDLTNPPVLNAENSIIRFSGGQGATNGLRPIWANPHLKRTFFPSTARPLAFEGTYISERELKTMTKASLLLLGQIGTMNNTGSTSPLTKDKTYWFAIAPVYDGFQLGPLTTWETPTDYVAVDAGADWTNNYLHANATGPNGIVVNFSISAAQLNKRITGFAIYMAQDAGNTSSKGRQTPYFFVYWAPIALNPTSTPWTFSAGATEKFQTTGTNLILDQTQWTARGSTYQSDSGHVEVPTDLMYSYSIEEIVGPRRFLSNCYVNSEAATDRSTVFTNPIGGNVTLGNADVLAPDVFSNEESIYRLRVQPTVGSKITSLVTTDIEEFLAVKDRGLVRNRVILIGNIPQLIQTVVSQEAGGATVNGWAKDDQGWIYTAGYADVWRYRNGETQALIEREDKNDWLDTYRNALAPASKENAAIFYLPDLKAIYFLFGNQIAQATGYNGLQYVYFPMYNAWRDMKLGESNNVATTTFKWWAKLQNGHVIGMTTHSIPRFERLLWKYSGSFGQYRLWFSDGSAGGDTLSIAPLLDTGEFIVSPGRDLVFNKVQIVKTVDSPTQGTLDCDIYLDGVKIRTYANQSKTNRFVILNGISTDRRLGYTFRLVYNKNTTDPERLNAGEKFQIDEVLLFGDTRPRRRATETSVLLGRGADSCVPILGTVAGKREVTITTANTDQTFNFDLAFTDVYVGSLGTEPAYRFDIDSAHPVISGVEQVSIPANVQVTARTLTSITLRSSEDNTIVRFSIS